MLTIHAAEAKLQELLTYKPITRSYGYYDKSAEERAAEDRYIREYNQEQQMQIELRQMLKDDYDNELKQSTSSASALKLFKYDCQDKELKKLLLSDTDVYPTAFIENIYGRKHETCGFEDMLWFFIVWVNANSDKLESLRNNYLWPRFDAEEVKELIC